MKFLKKERGFSLIEVVAAIVIVSIILLSFFGLFLQSKKTHVASESIVDTTYHAQQEMEALYGFISSKSVGWFDDPTSTLIELGSINEKFTYNSNCDTDCKIFLFTNSDSSFNNEHWIQLKKRSNSLVYVLINVPKNNSSSPVVMESIFRWRH